MIKRRLKPKDIVAYTDYKELAICYIVSLKHDYYEVIYKKYDLPSLKEHIFPPYQSIYYTSKIDLQSVIFKQNASKEEFYFFVEEHISNYIFK